MPQRRILSSIWTDPWFQELSADQGYLFIYLWSNDHCNQAGLYQITLSTIAFEVKLPADKITTLLETLKPKILWYPDVNLIWIKNFLRHQANAPTYCTAALNCVKTIGNNGNLNLETEFIKYNEDIWYRYGINTIAIPPNSNSNSNSKEGGSRGEIKQKDPPSFQDSAVLRKLGNPLVRFNRDSDKEAELIPLGRIGKKLPGSMEAVLGNIKKDIENRQKERAKKK